MNNNIPRLRASHLLLQYLAITLMLLFSSAVIKAVPYASGVTEEGDTVSFILNVAAEDVKVVFDGGASTLDLGAREKGTHSFSKAGFGAYEIVVSHDSGLGYMHGEIQQLSSDDNPLMRFFNQRGLAVNRNPASPNFGRVYVAISADGSSGGRDVQKGIYVINPDQTDALGQGDSSLTADLPWSTSSETPNRLFVGPDDNLYIADWSDASGGLYVTDANVSSGEIVLDGLGGPFPVTDSRVHGSINAVHVEGSLNTGDLIVHVIDEDLQTDKNSANQTERNSIWRWDIGGGPLPTIGPPTKISSAGIAFAAQLCDLARGPDGKFYKSQRRAIPASPSGQSTSVMVISEDGSTVLWSSIVETRALEPDNPDVIDYLVETRAIAVSPDGKYLAAFRNNNEITILPMVDGVPVMASRAVLPTLPTAGLSRAMAFDAAGNIYAVSSGQGLLRIYSPGGKNTVITRSDGTFEVIRPTSVTVVATDDTASEPGTNFGDTGEFTVTREGELSQPLTVHYTLSGTAVNGVDYVELPGSVIIPAGEASVTVIVTPIDNTVADPTRTVVLTIESGDGYAAALPLSASVDILCDEPPTLSIEPSIPAVMRRYAVHSDYAQVRVNRLGLIDIDVFGAISFSGTAVQWEDYAPEHFSIFLQAGELSATIDITALNNEQAEGDDTVVVTIDPDTNNPPQYHVGEPDSATVFILGDLVDSEPVLFAADLSSQASANDWEIRFGEVEVAGQTDPDFQAQFGYDYGVFGIPLAPGSDGSGRGLMLTVNKNDTVPAAAGVNVYPKDKNFTGNYALRFSMFLEGVNGAGTTEYVAFGIHHSGLKTNWTTQTTAAGITGPNGGDGLWFKISADASNFPGGQDYGLLTVPDDSVPAQVLVSKPASEFAALLKAPPFRFAGTPTSFQENNRAWVEVEVAHVNGVVTLSINRQPILEYANDTAHTSGNIMLGYLDPFASIGGGAGNPNPGGYVIYDNVRVVDLGGEFPVQPEITDIRISEGTVLIDFTGSAGDTVSSFTLLSSPVVTGLTRRRAPLRSWS